MNEGKTANRQERTSRFSERGLHIAIILLLIVGTFAVFAQVYNHDFIQLDDREYVKDNPHLQGGLTPANIAWAFTNTGWSANWHPVTWLSHMLDVQLFGMNAGRHHLMSVLLHILNSVLLFLVLVRMTKSTWKSAFVAALFAIHPVHVESVAWAAERKDVLSTLFWFFTMYAYTAYTEKPTGLRYALTLGAFTLGILAKPMLVTLPIVLLLLDYWPLGRVRKAGQKAQDGTPMKSWRELAAEKIPFFAIAVLMSVKTYIVQHNTGAVGALDHLPFPYRLCNAILAYVSYIGKMFWPRPLAVFYPHPATKLFEQPLMLGWIGALILLAAITFLVAKNARRRPYMAMGWLWYVGTLIPVIGLVQVGSQGSADRYTYVPLIGLFVMLSWGIPDLLAARLATAKGKTAAQPDFRFILGVPAALVLAVCLVLTYQQVGYWKNSVTIFEHAVTTVPTSHLAWADLGVELESQHMTDKGKDPTLLDRAIDCYEKSLAVNPTQAATQNNLGHALISRGEPVAAIDHLKLALKYKTVFPAAHFNLGTAYSAQSLYAEAVDEYKMAVDQSPDNIKMPALMAVADTLEKSGRVQEAVAAWADVIKFNPNSAETRNQFGMFLGNHGLNDQAMVQFKEAIRLDPKYTAAHYNLGYALKQEGKIAEAIQYYREALNCDPNFAAALYQMAIALYATGDYPGAWDYIHKCRAVGIDGEPDFLAGLSAKMREPKQ